MPENLIGKELLGQFRIMERIGRGGMGEVYKAEQPAMDRLVAIKILHAKLAARKDLVSRFRREARAMSFLGSSWWVDIAWRFRRTLSKGQRRQSPLHSGRTCSGFLRSLFALESSSASWDLLAARRPVRTLYFFLGEGMAGGYDARNYKVMPPGPGPRPDAAARAAAAGPATA